MILIRLFKILFWYCGDAFHFAREWFMSRSLRSLLQGSPAVFCFLGVMALLWLGSQSTAKALQGDYLVKAEEALANDQLVEADLYYRKVVQMAPNLPAGLLGQAQVAERNGKHALAKAIMLRLANNQHYAPAYMWLAEGILEDGKTIPPEMVPTLIRLLLSAVEHDPGQHRAHAMLGQIMFANRRYANALPHFAAAAQYDDKMRMPLARTLVLLGRVGDARAHANLAITRLEDILAEESGDHLTRKRLIDALMFVSRYSDSLLMVSEQLLPISDSNKPKTAEELKQRMGYVQTLTRLYLAWSRDLWLEQRKENEQMQQALLIQERRALAREQLHQATQHFSQEVQSRPNDVDARLRLAELTMLYRKFEEAESLLLEGRQVAGDDSNAQERLRVAMVRAYVEWAGYLVKNKSDDIGLSVEILERALKLAPDETVIVQQLVMLAAQFDIKTGKARELLDQMLAKNELPANVLLVLGTKATQADDYRTALDHLERAVELDPSNPSVRNNLAWTLSHIEPPQLERAKKLIDSAIEQYPKHAEMRATRAEILIKQHAWKLALADLEVAAQRLGNRPDILKMLATVRAELASQSAGD